MNLREFLKKYAEQIGGQYTEYDNSQYIIIVPLSGERFQAIVSTITNNDLYNRKLISLRSKVCPAKPEIDYKILLEQAAFFNYCRFIVNDNYLQVEAVVSIAGITEETVKEMVQEVANLADQYEMKLTGSDIY